MQYREFNKINRSIFDLIGNNEPSQTKGLGYLLARSTLAMKGLLELLYPTNNRFRKTLLEGSWIIDCEEREESGNADSLRSDIIIRFQKDYQPKWAIIIEAKGIGVNVDEHGAQVQAKNYSARFNALLEYSDKMEIVSLTKFISLSSDDKSETKRLRWQDIQKKFYSIIYNRLNRKCILEIELIEDYLHYLNNKKGAMKFYDEEVLVIPASKTLETIKKEFFYQCLAGTKHDDARANSHPLFVAFSKNSRVENLYRIMDIVKMSFFDSLAIDYITNNYPHLKKESFERCAKELQDGYLKIPEKKRNPKEAPECDRWVFILDPNNIIKLPKQVYIGWMQNHTFLTLQEMLNPPIKTAVGSK